MADAWYSPPTRRRTGDFLSGRASGASEQTRRVAVEVNGRKLVVEVDPGVTNDEIVREVEEQVSRGVKHASKPRQKGSGFAPADFAADWAYNAIIGVPEGIMNLGGAITDPLADLMYGRGTSDKLRDQRQAGFDEARRNLTTTDMIVPETAGKLAPALVLSRGVPAGSGTLGQIASGGVQGAIGGVATKRSEQAPETPALWGGLLGAGVPAAMAAGRWVGSTRPMQALGSAITNSAPVQAAGRFGRSALGFVDDLADDAVRGIDDTFGTNLGPGPTIPTTGPRPPIAPPPRVQPTATRAAQMREARLRAAGVENPTAAMTTRDPTMWTAQERLRKIDGPGDALRNQKLAVEQDLVRTGRGIVDRSGGTIGREETGRRLVSSLNRRWTELDDEINRLYTGVRESRGDVIVGNADRLRGVLDDPDYALDVTGQPIVKAVKGYLKKIGGDGKLTVSNAENVRKFISRQGGGFGGPPEARRIIRDLQNALDDDVVANLGDDGFAAGRAAFRARADEFEGLVGRLREGGIAPEKIVDRIMGGSADIADIRALRATLSTGNPEDDAALQALRSGVLDDTILGKPGSRVIDDDGAIKVSLLGRNWDTRQDKLRAILPPEAYKETRRFALAAQDALKQPLRADVNNSNSASEIANLLTSPETRGGLLSGLRTLGRLGAPFAGVPSAGVEAAGMVAEGAAQRALSARATQEATRQAGLISSPQAMTAALNEAQDETLRRAIREAAQRRLDAILRSPLAGGLLGIQLRDNQGRGL